MKLVPPKIAVGAATLPQSIQARQKPFSSDVLTSELFFLPDRDPFIPISK